MPRCVLLRHDLDDGSWHYDWLIERNVQATPDPDERCLISFRVAARPDSPTVVDLDAYRTPDHRRLYLDYQGEVSGGRGRVSRVFDTTCVILRDEPAAIELSLRTPQGNTNWTGVKARSGASPDGHPLWTFEAVRG